jgi:hypothetical protein
MSLQTWIERRLLLGQSTIEAATVEVAGVNKMLFDCVYSQKQDADYGKICTFSCSVFPKVRELQ